MNSNPWEGAIRMEEFTYGAFERALQEAGIKRMRPAETTPEPGTESAASEQTPDGKAQYWWLNANPYKWQVQQLKPGQEKSYTTYNSNRNQRKIYKYFIQARPGDLVIGYETTPTLKVVALLEISQGIHQDEKRNEVITFRMKELLTRPIDRILLENHELLRKSEPMVIKQGSLFRLTEEEFNAMMQLANVTAKAVATDIGEKLSLLPSYLSDGAAGDDRLSITHDVEAFASLICYKALQPPLAIGLFGNWGSGKSFFMNKLEKRIEELSTEPISENSPGGYCRNIVQVKFNAWHYSDANLWESLVTHIFAQLTEQLKNTGQKTIKDLIREELQTSRFLFDEARKEKEKAQADIDLAQSKSSQLRQEKEDKARQLSKLKLTDAFQMVLEKNPGLKKQVDKLAAEWGNSSQHLSLEKFEQLKTAVARTHTRLQKLWLFFRDASWPVKILYILLILSPLVVVPAVIRLAEQFKLDALWQKILQIAAVVGPPVTTVFWLLNKINTYLDRFTNTQTALEKKIEEEKSRQSKEEEALNVEIKGLEAQLEKANEKLNQAQERLEKAESEFRDFNVSKRMAEFILQRNESSDYRKNLGTISLIRADFERLSKLLLESRQEELSEEDKEKKYPKIDRIVLYIDDLDRCPKQIVVKVLEAIHLILALDLFVVVVGVDARWVSEALLSEYGGLIRDKDSSEALGMNGSSRGHASSYDYLEKIFQIPFVLKPMSRKATEELVVSLFDQQVIDMTPPGNKGEQTPVEPISGLHQSPGDAPELEENDADDEGVNDPASPMDDQDKSNSIAPTQLTRIEQLKISPEELEFMKFIAPMLGNTPRTVKRYVNIYRILRAHQQTPIYQADKLPDFKGIMLLLAVMVSNGDLAQYFIRELRLSGKTTLVEFIEEDKKLDCIRNLLSVPPGLGELEVQAHQRQSASLGQLPLSSIRQYLGITSRFSFRTLAELR